MPFSILEQLMANFMRSLTDESKVYKLEYPVYRDPAFTHDILCIGMERCNVRSEQAEQLTYADLLLLGASIQEHLGRIDDETCELEVFKRIKKGEDWEVVGRGRLGFTKAALLSQGDSPSSNTMDVRW